MANQISHADRILRLKHVLERTGTSRSWVYEAIRKGSFPKPIRLGSRSVGWVESEVNAYIQACITESRYEVRGGAR